MAPLPELKSGDIRPLLTFWIALSGMLIVFFAYLVAVLVFQDSKSAASTIVAVVGSITAVVGTLAGYVSGQAAGAAGKDQAETRAVQAQADAAHAQRQLAAVAGEAGGDAVKRARASFPDWFPQPAPDQPQEKPGGG